MSRINKSVNSIFFYCLEYGDESELLGVTQDWVSCFEKKGLTVFVVTTHLRTSTKLQAGRIFELGGGSLIQRIRAFIRVFRITLTVVRNRKNSSVFYHMSHKVLALQGWLLKLFGVHQTLWYSHARHDFLLPVANMFADLIITTSPLAYPLNHSSIVPVGQAVNQERFTKAKPNVPCISSRTEILSVGRVSRSKRLERIISELDGYANNGKISVHLYGPIMDHKYAKELSQLAINANIDIEWNQEVKYQDLPSVYQKYSLYFTGTDKAIDKAAIEAAMSGVIVMSENMLLLQRLGLYMFYSSGEQRQVPIREQFGYLIMANEETLTRMSIQSTKQATEHFSISNAIDLYFKNAKLLVCKH